MYKIIVTGGEVEHIEPCIEPHDTRADITKVSGWEPSVSLEEGINGLKNSK
jgi:hypothetical protein